MHRPCVAALAPLARRFPVLEALWRYTAPTPGRKADASKIRFGSRAHYRRVRFRASRADDAPVDGGCCSAGRHLGCLRYLRGPTRYLHMTTREDQAVIAELAFGDSGLTTHQSRRAIHHRRCPWRAQEGVLHRLHNEAGRDPPLPPEPSAALGGPTPASAGPAWPSTLPLSGATSPRPGPGAGRPRASALIALALWV